LNKLVLHKYENDKILDKVVSPVGRFQSCIKHWQEAKPGEYIFTVVLEGCKFAFENMPESVELKNNKFARENVFRSFFDYSLETFLLKILKPYMNSALTGLHVLVTALSDG
jgi:hypothetical protein